MKRGAKLLALALLLALFCTNIVDAITPEEIYYDGRRAFVLGHWQEARDHFDRFVQTWPEHSLCLEAQLFAALATLRSYSQIRTQRDSEYLLELAGRYNNLKDKISASELRELAIAIDEPALRMKAASFTQIVDLLPDQLNHLILRGFLPSPSSNPILTLSWINSWIKVHEKHCPSPLHGRLELWRALSLWALYLSPLAAQANSETLAKINCWPLDRALQNSIRAAFREGEPDVKRDAALLGISYETLSTISQRRHTGSSSSAYFAYLKERGIHPKEAFCPR